VSGPPATAWWYRHYPSYVSGPPATARWYRHYPTGFATF